MPATARGRRRLLLLCCGSLSFVLGGGCQAREQLRNPAGYPAIPNGRAVAAPPTPGGGPPTPVGFAMESRGQEEAKGQAGQGKSTQAEENTGPLGPSAGDPGTYEAMNGAGSASYRPTPAPTPTPPPSTSVRITPEGRFEPAELTVRRGDAVLWRNEHRSPQTVTCNPAFVGSPGLVALPQGAGPWGSDLLKFGDSFSHRFDVAGEYVYVRLPFERQGMSGRLNVRD